MAKDIIKNIPLTLDINARKRLNGTVDISLYSKDIATGQFEFTFIDEDGDPVVLDETYSAQALVRYNDEEKTYLDDMAIEGNIIRFIFPHDFITKDGTVTMYIYITKDNYTSDVAAISFPVFVSEIDKDLDPSISVHYIGKIEQLIEDMKAEIETYQIDIDALVAGYQEAITKLTNLETNYAPELENITAQLAHKAEQEELNTVSGQIDNLIANAGNTDGNAELLDIRVGWDGVTYPTAGDSVRSIQQVMGELQTANRGVIVINSEQTKPIVEKGEALLEYDTGKVFFYDGAEWIDNIFFYDGTEWRELL